MENKTIDVVIGDEMSSYSRDEIGRIDERTKQLIEQYYNTLARYLLFSFGVTMEQYNAIRSFSSESS